MGTRRLLNHENVATHLAGGVDNLCRKVLTFVANDFGECVLDRWVVALYETAVDELHCNGGFA